MEKIPIIMRGGNPDAVSAIEASRQEIEEMQKKGAERVEGEQDKSEQEIQSIRLVNGYVRDIFEYLDLEHEALPDERVHFLGREAYLKLFREAQGEDGFGLSDPHLRALYINTDPDVDSDRLRTIVAFSTLLHESVHFQSKAKYLLDAEEGVFVSYRSGYRMNTFEGSSFVGLNEAVVTHIERSLLYTHREEIARHLGIDPKDIEDAPYLSYETNLDLLHALARALSASRGEEAEDTLRHIASQAFTGNLMHLREVERIYGAGSLRLLARYGSEGDPALDASIADFFMEEDAGQRAAYLEDIRRSEKNAS